LDVTRVRINTDGASKGNPGPAAIGVLIKDEAGHVLATVSKRIGNTTNNQAEYRAVIAGLEKAISLGARQVVVETDSELIARQLLGLYKIKNAGLRTLYQQAIKLTGSLDSFNITSVPRERNAEADRLANQAFRTSHH
jgi:ribonuclease HI